MPLSASRGDTGGDSAHQRWLALVSAEASKTRINWRSLALAGARMGPDKREVGGSSPPRPMEAKSKSCLKLESRAFAMPCTERAAVTKTRTAETQTGRVRPPTPVTHPLDKP